MEQLEHYLQKWSLKSSQQIAETNTSTVYLVQHNSQLAVLKLLNETGIYDEQRGAIALRHYNGQGAAHLLNAIDDAHLLEYLPGDNLVTLSENGQDDQAAHIIAGVVTQLHSAGQSNIPQELHTLRRRFRSLLNYTGTEDTLKRGAHIAEKLLASERNIVVLHGDIHHWNIRHSERGWLAFDPKGLRGENTYDVANALINPMGMPHIVNDEARFLRHANIYATALNISPGRVILFAFAHACLSITWSIEDGDDYTNTLLAAKMMQRHI